MTGQPRKLPPPPLDAPAQSGPTDYGQPIDHANPTPRPSTENTDTGAGTTPEPGQGVPAGLDGRYIAAKNLPPDATSQATSQQAVADADILGAGPPEEPIQPPSPHVDIDPSMSNLGLSSVNSTRLA